MSCADYNVQHGSQLTWQWDESEPMTGMVVGMEFRPNEGHIMEIAMPDGHTEEVAIIYTTQYVDGDGNAVNDSPVPI